MILVWLRSYIILNPNQFVAGAKEVFANAFKHIALNI